MRKLINAFTIVELLIVVSVVAALLVSAFTLLTPQLKKSRDAKRKTDLYAISHAFEEYEKDNESYSPTLPQCNTSTASTPLNGYISAVPCDPQTGQNYVYEVGPSQSLRTWYRIYSRLEGSADPDIAELGCQTGCGPGSAYNYYVASPNSPGLAVSGFFPSLGTSPTPAPTATSAPTPTGIVPTSTPTTTPIPTSLPTPTTAPNLLTNPGFESGLTNWPTSGGAGVSVVSTQFHSGANSLEIIQPASGGTWVRQLVNVVAGRNYTMSGWLKTSLTSGIVTIRVIWQDSSGATIWTTIIASVTGVTNWTQYSTSYVAPAGAVSAYFMNNVAKGPGGNAWFDDLLIQ